MLTFNAASPQPAMPKVPVPPVLPPDSPGAPDVERGPEIDPPPTDPPIREPDKEPPVPKTVRTQAPRRGSSGPLV